MICLHLLKSSATDVLTWRNCNVVCCIHTLNVFKINVIRYQVLTTSENYIKRDKPFINPYVKCALDTTTGGFGLTGTLDITKSGAPVSFNKSSALTCLLCLRLKTFNDFAHWKWTIEIEQCLYIVYSCKCYCYIYINLLTHTNSYSKPFYQCSFKRCL